MMRSKTGDVSTLKAKPPIDLRRSTTVMESWYPSINDRAEPMLARGQSIASSHQTGTLKDHDPIVGPASPESSEASSKPSNLKLEGGKDPLEEARDAEAERAILQSSYRKRYTRGLRLLSMKRDIKVTQDEAEEVEPMLSPSEHAAINRKITAAERKLTRALTGYEVPAGSPIFDQMNQDQQPASEVPQTEEVPILMERVEVGPLASTSGKDESRILPENLDNFPLAELRAQLNLPDKARSSGADTGSKVEPGDLHGGIPVSLSPKSSGTTFSIPIINSKGVHRVSGPISLRAIKKLADQAMADHVKKTARQPSVPIQDYEDCVERPSISSSPEKTMVEEGKENEVPKPNGSGSLRRKRGARDLRKDAVSFSKAVTEIFTPSTPSTSDVPNFLQPEQTPRQSMIATPVRKGRLTPSKSPRRVSASLGYSKLGINSSDLKGDLATLPSQQSGFSPMKRLGTPGYMAPTKASKLAAREKTPGPKKSASSSTIGTIIRKPSIPPGNWPGPDEVSADELQDSPAVVSIKPRFRV